MEEKVMIYTDGACLENPGPGGYGVILNYGRHKKELSGGFDFTTNNRMEMMAAIVGLEALQRPCQVKLYSDSRYVVDAITKGWAQKWRNNNWWRNKAEKALNPDLWARLLELCEKHEVEFIWIKGHAGHTENERCDELAKQAAEQEYLPEDDGYDPEASTEKIKITSEGQPCRKCSTPVIKKTPHTKPKENQTYYYEYYLSCPNCKTMYMVEEAKRTVSNIPESF
jgi:ribonuclease HI